MPIDRRQFLIGSASFAAGAIAVPALLPEPPAPVPGAIVGANSAAGHRLRQGNLPAPDTTEQARVVIIGGGIAGLSAAWKLEQAGVTDYVLLELEDAVGGNAQSGQNAVSAYPWGAHYVPLLTAEAQAAQELFRALGIITGMRDGLPLYNEYHLCADPQERLYRAGRWQEGLVPQLGASADDQKQYQSFFAAMEGYKHRKGADGQRAFAIPVAYSSADADLRALDKIVMADYMAQQGWTSRTLRWYVDYCLRDDYGADSTVISAWAGIHYFAGRDGRAANTDPQAVVTWPEGNGWIVKQLRAQLKGQLKTRQLAYQVTHETDTARVTVLDLATDTSTRYAAQAVILAVPHFVSARLLPQAQPDAPWVYSPWMVANITLDALPQGKGERRAWDNVIYDSPMLGYVVATHQNLNRYQLATVLTYYWPLDHLPPVQARQEAIARPYAEWQKLILTELYRIHPELVGHVQRLDVWLWGHGMVRPVPDTIWNEARQPNLPLPLFQAHSDMSGISIFEEANYQGVRAAEAVLAHLKLPYRSSL